MPDRETVLKHKIITKLLRKRATQDNSVQLETFLNWFIKSERDAVERYVSLMADDTEIPVSRDENRIYISDVEKAFEIYSKGANGISI